MCWNISKNDIPKVQQMFKDLTEIKEALGVQIKQDFKDAFSSDQKTRPGIRQLAEACLLVSHLESRVNAELLKWVVDGQLVEYKHLFRENEEVGWLDKIDRIGSRGSRGFCSTSKINTAGYSLRIGSSRRFFLQLCTRFANIFIPKFVQQLFKCKPLGTLAAEQLLLDTHMLKELLLNLPKFVDQYITLVPERDVQEFHRILPMKGINRSEVTSFAHLCLNHFSRICL